MAEIDDLLKKQNELQQQLIEAQQEIIRLHQKLEKHTPGIPDDDVHWHQVSGGLTSDEVLKSKDLAQVRAYYEWIFTFGEKYIKPYVHLEAFGEMIAHMTRGLTHRLAVLEVEEEFGITIDEVAGETVSFPEEATDDDPTDTPYQPPLME